MENDKDIKIEKIINQIKKNQSWYSKVKKQAKERNIKEEDMLRKAAQYWIKTNKKQN